MPPLTTKRRTTTNFKNKKQPELTENRTVWKSDNQGVKEETFIQTSRRGGDGQLGGEDSGLGSGWRTRVGKAALGGPGEMVNFGRADPCSHTDKPGGTTGEPDRPSNRGFQPRGNKASRPLTENTCGGCGSSGRNSQPHGRVRWRDPQDPRTYTNPPPWESAPEGPNLIVGSGGSD